MQVELLERRQRAAVERSGEGGAAGVGDLGAAEVEPLELRQPSRRRRRRTCRRRRRHEGGEALVAERVASRASRSSAGSRRKAGARATSPASPMAALLRARLLSRGRAPCPRAAARAEAPASPTCVPVIQSSVTAGSAPAPSPAASCRPPSGPAAGSQRSSLSSAGSTEPSVPSSFSSSAVRPLLYQQTAFASRSALQFRCPSLRHNAAAASWPVFSCCSGARVAVRSSLLTLAQGHGDARVEHVAQLDEEDALLVAAQLGQRHRDAGAPGRARGGEIQRAYKCIIYSNSM